METSNYLNLGLKDLNKDIQMKYSHPFLRFTHFVVPQHLPLPPKTKKPSYMSQHQVLQRLPESKIQRQVSGRSLKTRELHFDGAEFQ